MTLVVAVWLGVTARHTVGKDYPMRHEADGAVDVNDDLAGQEGIKAD